MVGPQTTQGEDPPRLVGTGPAECSTSLALQRWPLWIADVNGYYRALHVDPHASRKQLREAYLALGGHNSERLTYILKTLLNPMLRRYYDSLPLGEVFIDRYIVDAVRRVKVLHASKAAQKGVHVNVDAEMRQAFGLPPEREETVGAAPLDSDVPKVQASPDPPEVTPPPSRPWGYAYYLWRTTSADTSNLAEWQELLVAELGKRGEVLRIAVGHHDRHPSPVLVGTVGYRTVVFLHKGVVPTRELAVSASERVLDEISSRLSERADDRRVRAG